MSLPTPKFEVGDKVYVGEVHMRESHITCTECKGTGAWKITTPKGSEFEIRCQACRQRKERNISVWKATPEVARRTIGSVQIDTSDEHPVKYMCKETGIGSGRVYKESKCFTSKEECLVALQPEVERQQAERDKRTQISVDYSTYIAEADFFEAANAHLHGEMNKLKRSNWHWGYVLSDIDCEIIETEDGETVPESHAVAVVEHLRSKKEEHEREHPQLQEPLAVPEKETQEA